jgi:heme/copper-type cytochrome/quinol oxidase subunit 1
MESAFSPRLAIGHGARGVAGSTQYEYSLRKGGCEMKLNAPKQATWLIALLLALVGVVAHFVAIPVLSGISFWLVLVAFVLLLVATMTKGL